MHKVLAKRGEFVHHIAFLSDDFGHTIQQCREAGLPLVLDENSNPDTMPWLKWNFIPEDKAHGVLIELATRYEAIDGHWYPRAAGHEGRPDDGRPCRDVEQREHRVRPVVGTEIEDVDPRRGVPQRRPVPVHHTLRGTRRARGVHHIDEVLLGPRCRRRRVRGQHVGHGMAEKTGSLDSLPYNDHMLQVRQLEAREPIDPPVQDDHRLGAGVGEEVAKELALELVVDRHVHGAGPHDAEPRSDVVGGRRQHRGDTVPPVRSRAPEGTLPPGPPDRRHPDT